jgi:hypothetical protein
MKTQNLRQVTTPKRNAQRRKREITYTLTYAPDPVRMRRALMIAAGIPRAEQIEIEKQIASKASEPVN